jgi:hypothetical protein
MIDQGSAPEWNHPGIPAFPGTPGEVGVLVSPGRALERCWPPGWVVTVLRGHGSLMESWERCSVFVIWPGEEEEGSVLELLELLARLRARAPVFVAQGLGRGRGGGGRLSGQASLGIAGAGDPLGPAPREPGPEHPRGCGRDGGEVVQPCGAEEGFRRCEPQGSGPAARATGPPFCSPGAAQAGEGGWLRSAGRQPRPEGGLHGSAPQEAGPANGLVPQEPGEMVGLVAWAGPFPAHTDALDHRRVSAGVLRQLRPGGPVLAHGR